MPTIYQKYRPRNFQEIVNQNHIKITLQNEIESKQITHAYLFCGPRGTGKTTMARVFTKSLNCDKRKEGKSEPCNKCEYCERVTQGTSLDIIEIDAASHTGVENVRENIIASARISVTPNKYKVFIIDEVHMLSTPAFNALLKTLEEPPQRVLFILCTTEVHKLPTTIISRCQRFDFKRISVSDIVKKLEYVVEQEGIKVDRKILESIARQSEGHMRDAESLLGQVISIGGKPSPDGRGKQITQEEADLVIPKSNLNLVIDFIEFLEKKDSAGAIRLINQLIDEGVDLKQFNIDLIETLRKMLLVKISPNLAEKFALDLGQSLEERISPLAKEMTVQKLIGMLNKFQEAKNELGASFIIQLPLEIATVSLCSMAPESPSAFVRPPAQIGVSRGQTVKSIPQQSVNITLGQIKEKWNEVLVRVKKYDHSLSFVLRVCKPKTLNNNQLCLVFKYKIHKDRVEQASTKSLIAKVLQEVYNSSLQVNAVLDEKLVMSNEKAGVSEGGSEEKQEGNIKALKQESKKDEDKAVEDVLKVFGGKVVK